MNEKMKPFVHKFLLPGLCENTAAHVYVVAQVALVQGRDIVLFKAMGFCKPSQ